MGFCSVERSRVDIDKWWETDLVAGGEYPLIMVNDGAYMLITHN